METEGVVGVDLIEIERVERALERHPRLAERIFWPGELESSQRGRPGRHLAARFAAKEAALKALGLGGLALRDVEVVGGGNSAPELRLHGRAAEAAARQGVELCVSLTHSRDLATAVVVAR
ncbi:MAG TPA: holo-ACP synthase [Solirubrobacterales bacterium]|nr:holo-ACP synthase [Solirubrobacterales bacterium]